MKQLQITRTIHEHECHFILSEEELELAYRIKQRQYLDEDFANTLADRSKDPDCRFHSGHLENFPELTTWLCEHYDHFFDANLSHNDLIELTINHLHHASLTPEFFLELARLSPVICEGIEKSIEHCEKNCPKYYRCSNISMTDDRSKKWEMLFSLLSMHKYGVCDCNKNDSISCQAYRYLSGKWDISDFFHSVTNI